MNQTVNAHVRGRVQGVGFRYTAVREANQLGLAGWIRNVRGGGVEVVAQGSSDKVAQFLDWLRVGPPSAEVESVEISTVDFDPTLEAFEVRF